MQRSRRSLLRRRALQKAILGRKRLYKFLMSLVLILWGLVIVFWMGLCNGLINGGKALVGEAAMVDVRIGESQDSFCYNDCAIEGNEHNSDLKSSLLMGDSKIASSNCNDLETCMAKEAIMGGTQCRVDEIGYTTDVQVDQSESNVNSLINSERQAEVEKSVSGVKTEWGIQKVGRSSRIAPPGLEEFKSKAIGSKGSIVIGEPGSIIHRVEPGGVEYNYAAASKGAKVLAYNKDAKGVANILNKDKDKYLRNPCSAEEKFVVIELSEETLVDTVEIANLEHYSSNLKDFELLSSLVYPTESWSHLGRFTAGNAKHAQRFSLHEPKWARYLKLNLLNHYGSEFYCTLSTVEVYGVDVIERMLEDLISLQDGGFRPEKISADETSKGHPMKQRSLQEDDVAGEDDLDQLIKEVESPPGGLGVQQGDNSYVPKPGITSPKAEASMDSVLDPVIEIRPQQGGRVPGDSVIKILMQKVRSLDLNFSILERYLEELNSRYGSIFKDFDGEISEKDLILEQIRKDIINLFESKEVLVKEIGEIVSWRSQISSQVDDMVKDNRLLRSDVERVLAAQIDMENKGLTALIVIFVSGSLAVVKLFIDILLSVCRMHKDEKFCRTSSGWLLLLLSSSITAIILLI